MVKDFKGRKGGGDKPLIYPQSPRTPDTLRSQDTFEILLGLGEGEIEGLVDGAKSLYFGDTPIENADGSRNFDGVDYYVYKGFPGVQAEVVSNFLGGTASNQQVGVALDQNIDVVRQVTKSDINVIDLRFVVSSLYYQNSEGIYTDNLNIRVRIKKSTTPNWSDAEFTRIIYIPGKTTSPYVKEIRVVLPEVLDGDFWQISVTKLTPDSDGIHRSSEVSWESYQEVYTNTKNYPDTAMIRLMGRASNQLGPIPEFWGEWKLRKVLVPANYDPVARTYSGIWNGMFKEAWTNNPAWILYDFVTNDRFGMSVPGPIYMDKYSVYEAAQWCDEMVSDGASGTQPRFTFNGLISKPRSARETARYIAGTFGGTLYDAGDDVVELAFDRDDAPAFHLFTPENVSSEGFQYGFTDVTQRYNDITVSFANPDLRYEEDRRRVFSQDQIDTYGRVPYDFIAVGCTSEAEAIRRANIKLISATTERQTVQFKTNRLGVTVRPMQVFLVSDPEMGYALSGRVKEFKNSRTTIVLDKPVTLEAGVNYKIQFRVSGDDEQAILERNLTVPSGVYEELTFPTELPVNVPDRATFIIGENPGEGLGAPKPFRVMKVEYGDDSDEITITGLEVNRNKFTDAATGVISTPTNFSGSGDPANILPPTNVEFDDRFDAGLNEVWTVVEPTLPTDAYKYFSGEFEVWSRPTGQGAFEKQELRYGNTVINHRPGAHEFKIVPKNLLGQTPALNLMPVWDHTVLSSEEVGTPPKAVTNISFVQLPRGFIMRWEIEEDQVGLVHHFNVRIGPDESIAVPFRNNIKEMYLFVDPMVQRTYDLHVNAVSINQVPGPAASGSYTNTAPAAPANLTAHVAYETIMLTYDRVDEFDVLGYRVQYRKIGDNLWLDMNPNGLFDVGEPNTAYEFRVAALDWLTVQLGDELWSTPLSARTQNNLSVEEGLDEVRQATTTNMIRNGSFEQDLANWTVDTGSVVDDSDARYADPLNGTSKILTLGDGTEPTATAVSDKVVVLPNRPYTLSVDFKQDSSDPGEAHYMTLRVYDTDSNLIDEFKTDGGKRFVEPFDDITDNTWTRLETTFQMPETARYAEAVIVSDNEGILYVDGVQLQRGSRATAFNPHVREEISPEDLNLVANPGNVTLGAPTALQAQGSFRSAFLKWNRPVYAPNTEAAFNFYEVWRAEENVREGDGWIRVGTPIAERFIDSIPDPTTTYYYWVRTINTAGTPSAWNAGVNAGVEAESIPLQEADFQNLSIVNALIADATIDDAKIANVSAGKIQAGTITSDNINLGDDRFKISGVGRNIIIRDEGGRDRVRLGRLGSGAFNYGLQVLDADGKLILGADGLGTQVVGSGNLVEGAVQSQHVGQGVINATHIGANSITSEMIQASQITSQKIAAGAITADKIQVASLAAISADLGTIVAGRIEAAVPFSNTNFWDLNTGTFQIGNKFGTQYIRYNPVTDTLEMAGAVEFTGIDYNNLPGTPQDLAALDPTQAAKLDGIQAGADVTASNRAYTVSYIEDVGGTRIPAYNVASWAQDPGARINNANVTRIDGSKIQTGTITANHINVTSLSSLAANIGTVTAGLLKAQGASDVYINLNAQGSERFIYVKNKFWVDANGNFSGNNATLSGNLIVDGTISTSKLTTNSVTQIVTNPWLTATVYGPSHVFVSLGTFRDVGPHVGTLALVRLNNSGTPAYITGGPNGPNVLDTCALQPSLLIDHRYDLFADGRFNMTRPKYYIYHPTKTALRAVLQQHGTYTLRLALYIFWGNGNQGELVRNFQFTPAYILFKR